MKRINIGLFLCALALLAIGLFFIYIGTSNDEVQYSARFIKHFFFVLAGLAFYVVLTYIDFEKLKHMSFAIFVSCLLLLLLTLAMGEIVNGARSWLGVWNFGIQPSEFAKIALLLYLSHLLELHKPLLQKRTSLLLYSLILLLPFLLVLLQPDFGTAFVFFPLGMAVFYIAGARLSDIMFILFVGIGTLIGIILFENGFFDSDLSLFAVQNGGVILFIIIGLCIFFLSYIGSRTRLLTIYFFAIRYVSGLVVVSLVLARIAIHVLKPYQISRLVSFIDPHADPLGSGWHILQSLNAVGSGGYIGRGFKEGSVSDLRYLPQHLTDFIYSFVAERWGFLGASGIVILYLLILWQVTYVAYVTKSLSGKLFCVGFLAVFFTHFIVNAGMTLGFMPITGIPLLLLSYGGSALFACMIGLGVISSCHRKSTQTHVEAYDKEYNNEYKNKRIYIHPGVE